MPTGHASLMPTLRRVVLAGVAADRTDGQLLGAFICDRDADAFGLLVRRHGPMVLGVCRRVIHDTHAADDAFQAVFIVLARRAAAVKPREHVANWLYGVAYRTALKARALLARRRSREKQVDVMPEPPTRNAGKLASPASPEDWADLQPVIDEELARLPEKLRVPVVLCDLEGRPQREVAKQLSVPPATLATRLATARRTLAQRLTRRGVTLSGGAVAGLLTTHAANAAVPFTLTVGITRAAEAVATGAAVSGCVSASAVQLSEGVLRMMLLTKLKALAVVALTVAAVTGGLGLGLVPAHAGGEGDDSATVNNAASSNTGGTAAESQSQRDENREFRLELQAENPADDLTFLRRLSLDLRGLPPTDIENFFFISDDDETKREKVVEWMLADDETQARMGKALGVPAGRVVIVRVRKSDDGKHLTLTAEPAPKSENRVRSVAFSPDGQFLFAQLHTHDEEMKVQPHIIDLAHDVELRVHGNQSKQEEKIQVVNPKDGKTLELNWDVAKGGDSIWIDDGSPKQGGVIRVWDAATGKQMLVEPKTGKTVWVVDEQVDEKVEVKDGKKVEKRVVVRQVIDGSRSKESDLDFLKRVTTAARGTPPTKLEETYFTADKDPKKREKLIDSLLKEPAVAKKLGEDFKKRMLSGSGTATGTYHLRLVPEIEVEIEDKKHEHKDKPKQKQGMNEFKQFRFVIPGQPGKEFKFDPNQFEWKGLNFTQPMIDPKQFEWKDFNFQIDPKQFEWKNLEFKPNEGNFNFQVVPFPMNDQKGEFKFVFPNNANPNVPKPPKPPVPPKPGVTVKPPVPPTPPAPPSGVFEVKPVIVGGAGDKLEKLVDALLAAKKNDAEMLEAITLATASRLPTDAEKRLTLGLVAKSQDRKAAWLEVAKAMAGEQKQEVRVKIVTPEDSPKRVPPAK